MPTQATASDGWSRYAVPLLLAATALTYVWLFRDRGWIPHDEGALGQAAERILLGEFPHRDFDDVYTGGLAFLHALAFRLFGISTGTIRGVLSLAFLAWVPALYWIARRFTGPWGAGGTTLTAIVWSVPNYFAGMPSWYNLFFATFGIAALIRYIDTDRAHWLFLAGLAGGLSVLVKLPGLYYLVGATLFLVHHSQISRVPSLPTDAPSRLRVPILATLLLVPLLLSLGPMVNHPSAGVFVHYSLPGVSAVAFVIAAEARGGPASRFSLGVLRRLAVPFVAGCALPIALFLIPYASTGSLLSVIDGVLIKPARRMEFAALGPLPMIPSLLVSAPAVALLLSGLRPGSPGTFAKLALGAAVAGLVFAVGVSPVIYPAVWFSVDLMVPLILVAGVLSGFMRLGGQPDHRIQQVAVILFVLAFHNLIQYPYAAPIYFLYAAPLGVLAIHALISLRQSGFRFERAVIVGFYVAFGMMWVNTGYMGRMGTIRWDGAPEAELRLDRSGIRISQRDRDEYEELVRTVQEHATGGYILATPDSPEVYFLSGLRNPTRTLFEFFDDSPLTVASMNATLDSHAVNVVVINNEPVFSGSLPPDLAQALVGRYPDSTTVGRFTVRWEAPR